MTMRVRSCNMDSRSYLICRYEIMKKKISAV